MYISLNQQIKHFQTITIPDLRTQFNNTGKLSSYLAKSIFVFNSGGNDCAQECSGSVRKEKCASDEFLDSLLANFTHQLKVHDFISFGIFCQSTAGAIHPYLTFQEQRFCKLLNSGVYWRVFLQIVYNLGARKFVLFGIQANGCNPMNKATLLPTEKCREDMNNAAITFNSLLRSSIDELKKSLPGSDFVFVNTYGIVRNVFDNPESYGT